MADDTGTTDGTTDDASVVADAIGAGTEGKEESTWNYAEGVAGQGEKPEWFKGDKYSSIADQAKAYTDLESKFGSFTGSPEEFEINLSEELKEKGIEISSDDVLMEEARTFAKEANMSQKGFDDMINLYAMAKVAEGEAMEAHKQEELKALGNNAQTRIDNLNSWAQSNLPEDMMEGFQSMAMSAAAVQTLEKLVAMTRNAPVNANDNSTPGGITEEELKKMQFEKDDFGNRRIQTDPAFRKEFEKKAAQVWGAEDHRIVVGG
jgi:hypothetical protein